MTKPPVTRMNNASVVGISVLSGCLGLIIVIAALFLGLWLNNQLGQRWPIVLVITLSAPLSLYLMVVLAMKLVRRFQNEPPRNDGHDKEEEIS